MSPETFYRHFLALGYDKGSWVYTAEAYDRVFKYLGRFPDRQAVRMALESSGLYSPRNV